MMGVNAQRGAVVIDLLYDDGFLAGILIDLAIDA